jgi:hypothetical protein
MPINIPLNTCVLPYSDSVLIISLTVKTRSSQHTSGPQISYIRAPLRGAQSRTIDCKSSYFCTPDTCGGTLYVKC